MPLHAYCLLPNQYHLIVEATRRDLSSGMTGLCEGVDDWPWSDGPSDVD